MNIAKVSGVRIEAVYACVPQIMIDNLIDLEKLYGSDAKSIVKATGIQKRYLVEPGTSSLDLCCSCAEKLIEENKIKKEDIGGIVCVTFTPETYLSFNAAGAQDRLGLDNNIPAFDINLACSGYPYGLWIASFLVNTYGKKVLLLDGDVQSAYLSGQDKSTTPVMADAGSASLLTPDANAADWYFSFYTDGSKKSALTIPAGGSGRPMTPEDLEVTLHEDGMLRREADIYMDGFAVFKFVAQDVVNILKQFMETMQMNPNDLEWFVPHQANMFMIKKLAKDIGFAKEVTWLSGDEVGNSASATIPVTIAKCAKEKLVEGKNSKVLLAGFGGGLSVGCAMIELDPKAAYRLFQYNGG